MTIRAKSRRGAPRGGCVTHPSSIHPAQPSHPGGILVLRCQRKKKEPCVCFQQEKDSGWKLGRLTFVSFSRTNGNDVIERIIPFSGFPPLEIGLTFVRFYICRRVFGHFVCFVVLYDRQKTDALEAGLARIGKTRQSNGLGTDLNRFLSTWAGVVIRYEKTTYKKTTNGESIGSTRLASLGGSGGDTCPPNPE